MTTGARPGRHDLRPLTRASGHGRRHRRAARPHAPRRERSTQVRLPRLARHSIELADGHQVGVAVCGEGVPFVLVHGFSAEGMLYAQALWRLVDMGSRSSPSTPPATAATQGLPTGGGDFADYTDLLGRVLDALGIEQAVFAGHSMGGRLVTELAAKRPERVIAVVLVDAIVGRPGTASSGCRGSSRRCSAASRRSSSSTPSRRCRCSATGPRPLKLGRLVAPTLVGHARRPWRLLGPAVSIIRSPGSGPMLDKIRMAAAPALRRARRPRRRRAPVDRPRRGPTGRRRARRRPRRHPLLGPQGPRGDAGDRARADAGPAGHGRAQGPSAGRPRRRRRRGPTSTRTRPSTPPTRWSSPSPRTRCGATRSSSTAPPATAGTGSSPRADQGILGPSCYPDSTAPGDGSPR